MIKRVIVPNGGEDNDWDFSVGDKLKIFDLREIARIDLRNDVEQVVLLDSANCTIMSIPAGMCMIIHAPNPIRPLSEIIEGQRGK